MEIDAPYIRDCLNEDDRAVFDAGYLACYHNDDFDEEKPLYWRIGYTDCWMNRLFSRKKRPAPTCRGIKTIRRLSP